TVEINLLGQIYLTREIVPVMKKQKSGTIVNIISQAGIYGRASKTIYNATKFAMTGFTKSWEMELKEFGIRVIGVYPGKMSTEMFAKLGINKKMDDAVSTNSVAKTIKFILSLPEDTTIPEIGIKHVKN
ncbi:MAG: SDR family oxidoreductase, partial [Candidatus Diapherotrites archaeon]|nr:SDR family oxidoreductase [Candidatus Diapherotrites archaeon]